MSKNKKRLPDYCQEYIVNFDTKSEKQKELVSEIKNKEIVVSVGVAGSGKTYVALATALSMLGPVYKKIILIKSVTTIPGEAIGFIPGSYEEKMDPFIMSYT